MGIDLTLHVVEGEKPYLYCPTRLDLAKDYDLLDVLEPTAKAFVIEELGSVWAHAGDDYKPLGIEDACGRPFRFSTAGELCKAANGYNHEAARNRAAFAYLRELPALTPIVLDFH